MEIHELKPVYDQILDYVAEKHGLEPSDVADIWRANFEFMRHKMETESNVDTGYFPTFMIQGFGRFLTSKKTRERIKGVVNKRREKNGLNRVEPNTPNADNQSDGVHDGAVQEDSR